MAGYLVHVCDLCRQQVANGGLLRFTVPLTTDPRTGEPRQGYAGGHDYAIEVCLPCVQTRYIRRLVEAAIAKTTRDLDAEPQRADGCSPVPG